MGSCYFSPFVPAALDVARVSHQDALRAMRRWFEISALLDGDWVLVWSLEVSCECVIFANDSKTIPCGLKSPAYSGFKR